MQTYYGACTNLIGLAKINTKKKHVIPIVQNGSKLNTQSSSKTVVVWRKILNVYQMNIVINLIFMQNSELEVPLKDFFQIFQKPLHEV